MHGLGKIHRMNIAQRTLSGVTDAKYQEEEKTVFIFELHVSQGIFARASEMVWERLAQFEAGTIGYAQGEGPGPRGSAMRGGKGGSGIDGGYGGGGRGGAGGRKTNYM